MSRFSERPLRTSLSRPEPSSPFGFRPIRASLFWLGLAACFWVWISRQAAAAPEEPERPRSGQPTVRMGESWAEPKGEIPSAHEVLFRANQDYLEGRYAEAARGYESLLSRGDMNGHVLYNLGNACLRNGQLGKAILQYRKALLLLPRDGDLEANLEYARSLRPDRLEPDVEGSSPLRALTFWYRGLNLREFLTAFLVLHALLWAVALLRLYRPSEALSWAFVLLLLASVSTAGAAAFKWRDTLHASDGVILDKEVEVRSGFTERDTVLFVLHEGAEFEILGEEAGWWKIELADGKKGWIPARSADKVSLGS